MVERYALVVDSDVIDIIIMNDEHPVAEKWIAALDSDISFVKINNYSQVKPGFFYKNEKFYDKDDLECKTALEESVLENKSENKYAGIVDNEVIGLMTNVKEEVGEARFEMFDAGMLSNPKVVKYTNLPNEKIISAGWKYDGVSFYLEGKK